MTKNISSHENSIKMIKLFLAITFLISALLTIGQSTAKTEVEIQKLEQIGVMAILKGDTNTLRQVWAPEFLVNNPRNVKPPYCKYLGVFAQ